MSDGQQVQAVIIDKVYYQQLIDLANREIHRQKALAMHVPVQTQEADFETLEKLSQKFADLSDEGLDTLFGDTLAEVRATNSA